MGSSSIGQVNQKKMTLSINNNYWIHCPRCYLIPSIKPFLMKGELYVSLYCKCSLDEKEFMPLEKYKEILTQKKEPEEFCKKHKSVKGHLFCITCEKWLCESCYLSHEQKYQKHLFNKLPIRIREYCHSHEKEPAVGYCNGCLKNICENCVKMKLKLRHDIFEFKDKEFIEKCNKKWTSFIL